MYVISKKSSLRRIFQKKNMQAVILAGGKGTRLGALTMDMPKPMVIINGKPFLEHLILNLRKNEICDILICTGYMSGKIEDYFNDGSGFGIEIKYSIERELLGTGGALKNAEKFLKEYFVLLNGDTYLPIDYKDLMGNFKAQGRLGMSVVRNAELKNGNMSISNNLVTRYDKKAGNMDFTDAGVQAFRKGVLRFIPQGTAVSLEEDIFPRLIKKKQLAAYVTKISFHDMGTMEGLILLKRILK